MITQNADSDKTPKDYAHLGDDKLLVHGVFATIQGEGPYAGCSSVFVRLAGCNYGSKEHFCKFCDTDFAFHKGQANTFEELEVKIEKEVLDRAKSDTNLVVITGGEPTIQPNLGDFVVKLLIEGWVVQIETNGSQLIEFNTALSDAVLRHNESIYLTDSLHMVVSPKASHKGYGRLVSETNIAQLAGVKHDLKFVVDANPESLHHEIPSWISLWQRMLNSNIYISPLASYKRPYTGEIANAWDHTLIDAEETSRNYKYAAKLCLENNYRLSIQQHIFAGIA